MFNYPEFAEAKEKRYKINTDFKIALKCNEIAESDNISNEERSLAIIYLLFGDEGLKASENWKELLKIAIKYLKCGKDIKTDNKEADVSYMQDIGYIETSFYYDYQIDLKNTQMHWWEFYEKLCGLSEKCILNRIRYIRNYDISQIKDKKEKQKIIEQKELFSLKKNNKKRAKTKREKELDKLFREQIIPQRR